MSHKYVIRRANPADFDGLGEVVHRAIHEGADRYTLSQRAAWSPAPPAGPEWAARLAPQSIWLAERAGAPVGFLSLHPGGALDFAYILPEAQGQGVFRALYAAIEVDARQLGRVRLWTHASRHARGPFERVGFEVECVERIALRGEVLERFLMEKLIA